MVNNVPPRLFCGTCTVMMMMLLGHHLCRALRPRELRPQTEGGRSRHEEEDPRDQRLQLLAHAGQSVPQAHSALRVPAPDPVPHGVVEHEAERRVRMGASAAKRSVRCHGDGFHDHRRATPSRCDPLCAEGDQIGKPDSPPYSFTHSFTHSLTHSLTHSVLYL